MRNDPKHDYLWDGSGEPDPDIQRLETVLGKLRHNRPAPQFPAITTAARPSQPAWWRMDLWPGLAGVAAGLVLIVALGLMTPRTPPAGPVERPGWDITRVAGSPRVGSQTIDASGKLTAGQTLETDSVSKANMQLADIGEIDIDPGTRLRLPESSAGVKRLALDHGTIHASIWAPAGEFVVDTPSAVAVDLGCTYTLHVDDAGNGHLQTTFGWVGFKLGNHESFIPAGAACSTSRTSGPGTPYFEDASEAFRSAVAQFDRENSSPSERDAALQIMLSKSRKRDALTLWHLLSRVDDFQRSRVYDRLAKLVPAPNGISREGVLRLDQQMLDLWWNELDLGDISLWRHWERSWTEQKASR